MWSHKKRASLNETPSLSTIYCDDTCKRVKWDSIISVFQKPWISPEHYDFGIEDGKYVSLSLYFHVHFRFTMNGIARFLRCSKELEESEHNLNWDFIMLHYHQKQTVFNKFEVRVLKYAFDIANRWFINADILLAWNSKNSKVFIVNNAIQSMERRAVRCVKVAECVINVPLFARILVSKKKNGISFFFHLLKIVFKSAVYPRRARTEMKTSIV